MTPTKPKTLEDAAAAKPDEDKPEAEKPVEPEQPAAGPDPEPEEPGDLPLPTVAILLLTYEPGGDSPRNTAATTLEAALKHINYSGPLILHIADDGSERPGHVDELTKIAGKSKKLDAVSSTNSKRGGYGANYNLATQVVHQQAHIVLPLEDDWELRRDLDLDPLVAMLVQGEHGANCIRLGYLGYTQPLAGTFVHSAHVGAAVLLSPDSPERHVYAGHPRLETVGFEREIGEWPVGLAAGATEFEVCGRPESRRGIIWPFQLNPDGDLFAHIGSVSLNGEGAKE